MVFRTYLEGLRYDISMIRMLRGTIADMTHTHLILDVGGVGYLVAVRPDDARGAIIGSERSLFTYLAVREDALDLYGFSTRDDLAMFEHLIDLPKIGPKSALAILSQASIELISKAVSSDDAAYLSKMSGMGKKTAEKIVQGLKDKLDLSSDITTGERGNSDTIDALIALGYSEREARDAVQKLDPETTDTNARVKEALRSLAR